MSAGKLLAAGLVAVALTTVLAALRPPDPPPLAALLAAGDTNRFPADDGKKGEPFTVAFYSDPQGNPDVHARICRAVLDLAPRFVVMGGDAVNESESESEWVDFLQASAPLRARLPYLPVNGNHDAGGLTRRVLRVPGGSTWYARTVRHLRIVVLDTEVDTGPDSPQGRWARHELACAMACPFTVVFHHKPVISSGRYFSESDRAPLRDLNPLFLEYGVDLSFCGHEHFYERLEADGLTYVVADGGGAFRREPSLHHPGRKVLRTRYHYCVARVFADRIEVRTLGLSGDTLDAFTVHPR